MRDKGLLIVASAPSGCGKTTVLHRLMELRDDLHFSVSATTRPPRDNEKEGVHYSFITQERFDEMVRAEAFLEHAKYSGYCYGTPRAAVEEQLCLGCDVYLDIDVQGARQVRARCPDALFIFLMPPSMEELRRRLVSRGTESAETLRRRLEAAEEECAQRGWYDHIVVNDLVNRAAEEISRLIDEKKKEMRNEGYHPAHNS